MRNTGPVQRTWNRLVVFVIAYPCAKHGIASLRSYKRTIKRFVECRPSGTRARVFVEGLPPPPNPSAIAMDTHTVPCIFSSPPSFFFIVSFHTRMNIANIPRILDTTRAHHVIIKIIEFSRWRVQEDVSNW